MAMKINRFFFGITVIAVLSVCISIAQEGADEADQPAKVPSEPREEAKVTAVYGLSSDDYLSAAKPARKQPKVRGRVSRPSLDLPDAFYYVGGPIFLLLFLRIVVIFLRTYEEKRSHTHMKW
ncbi:MAG: hypothetical protein ABFR47_01835 [Verrucomicrobiota bacterium]